MNLEHSMMKGLYLYYGYSSSKPMPVYLNHSLDLIKGQLSTSCYTIAMQLQIGGSQVTCTKKLRTL